MQKSLPLVRTRFLALSLCLVAAPAAAQITFSDQDTAGVQPLALSISGGISLGSYQAGVNYGLLEVYRHAAWNPEFQDSTEIPRYRLRSVTGASAGNVNTLLWAIEACTDVRERGEPYRSPDPSNSLFWQVWLSIGWDRLFDPASDELALFDREALTDIAEPLLKERMADRRLVEDCAVPSGITLTRITPDTLRLQGLPIETQRHVTAFDVEVDSYAAPLGRRVRFRQADRLDNDDQHLGILVRLDPHDGDIPLETMLEAVKASASFPVAFAPVELAVWYPSKGTETHSFVDGGFFDNNPVGLARSIYAASGGRDTLDILYVDPDRFRSRLAENRAVPPTAPPNGGLAAVIATIQGAVPTARQYELQLLARERAFRQREERIDARLLERGINPDTLRRLVGADTLAYRATERLLLSSRAYPVLGEHLGAFGGFLARPGREFDFYVGLYDGLYMATWYHTCREFADSTAFESQQKHRCVGNRLPALLQNPDLVRDPARQVLSWLYASEFAPMTVPVHRTAEEAEERVTVQHAFFTALGTQFRPADPTACVDKRVVSAVLCHDGLLMVLDTLGAHHHARGIMSRWQRVCTPECWVESDFVGLIDNPMWASTRMLDGLLERLVYVEGLMRDRPDARGGDVRKPILATRWLFEASHLRSRPRWDLTPNSVPSSTWIRKIPISYLGANLGTPGLEIRYQPVWNRWNPQFIRGNVIFHYNSDPILNTDRWYAGVGISASRYVPNVALSEFGIGMNVFRPVNGFTGDVPTPYELEGYVMLIANQLRVGGRLLIDGEHRGLIHGKRGWAFSVGLSDPIGLMYWMKNLGS